jgi:hypothetical protein
MTENQEKGYTPPQTRIDMREIVAARDGEELNRLTLGKLFQKATPGCSMSFVLARGKEILDTVKSMGYGYAGVDLRVGDQIEEGLVVYGGTEAHVKILGNRFGKGKWSFGSPDPGAHFMLYQKSGEEIRDLGVFDPDALARRVFSEIRGVPCWFEYVPGTYFESLSLRAYLKRTGRA